MARRGEVVLGNAGDALLDLGGDLRAAGEARLHEVLDARAQQVGLRRDVLAGRADLALDARAALAQLALDARAGLLDLALDAVALGAATLPVAELLARGAAPDRAADRIDTPDRAADRLDVPGRAAARLDAPA